MDRRRLSGKLRRDQRHRHRMAGEGGYLAASGGRRSRLRIRRDRTRCDARVEFARGTEMPRAPRAPRRFATFLFLIASFLLALPAAAGDTILSSRVWPAQEYTRVTLESARPIKHQFFFVKDPERLVVDLEGVDVNDALKGLPAQVS